MASVSVSVCTVSGDPVAEGGGPESLVGEGTSRVSGADSVSPDSSAAASGSVIRGSCSSAASRDCREAAALSLDWSLLDPDVDVELPSEASVRALLAALSVDRSESAPVGESAHA